MNSNLNFEENVIKLKGFIDAIYARNITAPAAIGAILRDQYSIGNVKEYAGKKLSAFLKVTETDYQRARIKAKLLKINLHLKKNKKDYPTARRVHVYTAKLANL